MVEYYYIVNVIFQFLPFSAKGKGQTHLKEDLKKAVNTLKITYKVKLTNTALKSSPLWPVGGSVARGISTFASNRHQVLPRSVCARTHER